MLTQRKQCCCGTKKEKRVVKNAMAVCVALQPLQLEVQAELQVHCDVADEHRASCVHRASYFFVSSSTQTNEHALKRVPIKFVWPKNI